MLESTSINPTCKKSSTLNPNTTTLENDLVYRSMYKNQCQILIIEAQQGIELSYKYKDKEQGSMSEKDQGNTCFKNQQYSQAIEHYQRYLEQEHNDNKKAWFNMSLCHSKLNHPKESIQAAQTAKQIDRTYAKCYYRLAHEYQRVKGKEYDVLANAVQFQKYANQSQKDEKKEMHQLVMQYKKYLNMKVNKKEENKFVSNIIQKCEELGKDEQIEERIEVDKQFDEWLQEWNQGPQNQEAKWCEIEYITQQIDYAFGINLAYFYLNQLKCVEQKKIVKNSIKELMDRLNKEKYINLEELGLQYNQKEASRQDIESDDSSQNLFEDKEPQQNKQKQKEQQAVKAENPGKKDKQTTELEKNQSNIKKTPQSIQDKLLEKKKKIQQVDNSSIKEAEKITPKVRQQQQQVKKIPTPKPETHQAKIEQPKSQDKIQELYNKHCGQLSKSKDIFKETYKCVLRILEDKSQNSEAKGKLLVLLRKRGKKFKLVMEATSQNEQIVVFDLLKKNKMEEYAVDVAPKYHKL